MSDERGQVRSPRQLEGEFRWLPPADGTLFALGLNYADHASELALSRQPSRWCLSKRQHL
jgi:5-oxopent-3-ene-1,2,5-tricarboxylate decarboxylase/2-hydroxyhepta-2,4-diene-1,7-dioate isomerase